MAAYDETLALEMVKSRLDRLTLDTGKKAYIEARIEAAAEELAEEGITITDSMGDLLLIVDLAVYNYGNRDKNEPQPKWLRQKITRRFLNDEREAGA